MPDGSRRFNPLPSFILEEDEGPLPTPNVPQVVESDPREVGLRRSIGSGVESVIGAARGAVAAGASILGADEFAEEQAAKAAENAERAAELAPAISDVRDVQNISDLGNFLTGIVGTQGAVMAALVAGGPAALGARSLAVRAGSRAAARVTPTAAATTGLVGAASTVETGSIFNEALEDPDIVENKSLREIGLASAGGGLIAGSLEALPVIQAANRLGLGRTAQNTIQRSLSSRVGRAAAVSAGSEAATEAAQTVIERGTLKFLNNNFEIFDEEGRGEILNAAVAGAVIGGGLGGLTGIPSGGPSSSFDDRINALEEADEQNEAGATVAAQELSKFPGLNDSANFLGGDVGLPDNQDALLDMNRRFSRSNIDVTTDIVRSHLRDPENTPPEIAAVMRRVASGEIELTKKVRNVLEPFFGTFSNGESVLSDVVEALDARQESAPELGETVFEIDDKISLRAPREASLIEANLSGLKQIGSLKREFTNTPEGEFTSAERAVNRINEDALNDTEGKLADVYDVIKEHQQDLGLQGAELNEALDKAGNDQFTAAIEGADQARVEQLTGLFEQGAPREFLRNFQVVAKTGVAKPLRTLAPLDFTKEEIDSVIGKGVFDSAAGTRGLGESGFEATRTGDDKARVVDAVKVTKLALRKNGVNPSAATAAEVEEAFFSGITSLVATPDKVTDFETGLAQVTDSVIPKSFRGDLVVHRNADGTVVTYGEVSATPKGKSQVKLAQLRNEAAGLPRQIAQMKARSNLTEKQAARLARLEKRREDVGDDIRIAEREVEKRRKEIRSEEIFSTLQEGLFERENIQDLDTADKFPEDGPETNPFDVPVADAASVSERANDERRVPAVQRNRAKEYVADMARFLNLDLELRFADLPIDTNGTSDLNEGRVVINSNLKNDALRIETIAHEIGHIYLHKVSKVELTSKEQKLADEMKKAFLQWRAVARNDTVRNVVTQTDSYSSAIEVLGLPDNQAVLDKKLSEISEQDATYLVDFHEWFANQTARWATTQARPLSIVEKFFDNFARVLKKIFGEAKKKGYTPTKEFNAFMAETIRARATTRRLKAKVLNIAGNRLPKNIRESRRTIITSALTTHDPYSEHTKDAIRNMLETDLNPEERRVVLNAFTRGGVRVAMGKLLRDHPRLQESVKSDPLEAAAVGYQLWSAGLLKLGPQTEGVFQSFAQQLFDTMAFSREHTKAEEIMATMRDAVVETDSLTIHEFEVEEVTRPARLAQASKNMSKLSDSIFPMMQSIFSSASSRIRAFDNPFLTELVRQFYVAPGDIGAGQSYFEGRTEFIGRWQNIAVRAINKLSDAQLDEVAEALKDPTQRPTDPEAKKALRKARRMFGEILEYARENGVEIGNAGKQLSDGSVNYFPRVWDVSLLTQNRDRFIAMMKQDKYAANLQKLGRERSEENEEIDADELIDNIYDTLINNDGYEETGLLDEDRFIHVPFAQSVNKRVLDFLEDSDVSPFTEKDVKSTILSYITQVVKRAEFTKRFGKNGRNIEDLLDKAKSVGATDAQMAAAESFVEAMQGTYGHNADSNVRKFFTRLRGLVRENGEMDRMLEKMSKVSVTTANSIMITWQNIRLLAMATLSSLIDILGPALRGDFNSAMQGYKAGMSAVIAEIQAKKSGAAKPELIELAEALGIVNEEMTNQALAWEFGTTHMSKTARHINDTFFKYTGLTFWTRMTRIMATASAEAWLMSQANNPTENTDRWLGELNLQQSDITFNEDNRLQFLTRNQRKRLKDLGDEGSLAEIARDDRVRAAMVRWVDGAILRPNAAQRPIWASSPAWQLVFHLKGFMYSAHETWLKRVVNEGMNGNMMPMVYFMGMVPIIAASDWLRDRIQNFGESAPHKAEWGVADHAWNSVQRAGILGIGQLIPDLATDAERHGLVSIADFGSPSADQTRIMLDIMDGGGDGLRNVVKSLPAQNVWGNWPWVPK